MSGISQRWPVKTRELHNHHFDSTIWNEFEFRNDDIVIATYAKSGTTWVQQIVAQLLFQGADGLEVAEMSPWLDLRVPPKAVKLPMVEAQPHRRFIKTHLPVDALVYSPLAKYLYIGRDGRDVVWSMYNHHANANALWYQLLNETPGRIGPPIGPPPASTPRLFRRMAGPGRPPVLAVLGECPVLVGDPRAAESAAAAFRRAEGRPAGPDPADRRVPRYPDRRAQTSGRSSSIAASPT